MGLRFPYRFTHPYNGKKRDLKKNLLLVIPRTNISGELLLSPNRGLIVGLFWPTNLLNRLKGGMFAHNLKKIGQIL